MRIKLIALAAVPLALLLSVTTAFAGGAYPTGTTGYDVSHYQCGLAAPRGSFGIVQVNQGRPFDQNPCLGSEYSDAAATGDASLYINTGYDPVYTDANHTTAACANLSLTTVTGSPDQQAAWAAGCSEASKSIAYATSQGAGAPRALWLDVETANSWSVTDLSLNRYTIDGIVATAGSLLGAPVGVYSTASMWTSITGGYSPAGVAADWVATGLSSIRRARTRCTTTLTGAPVWLVQAVTSSGDQDYAC